MSKIQSMTCQSCLFKWLCNYQEKEEVGNHPESAYLEPGDTLYSHGKELKKLYAIKSGALKSVTSDDYIADFYFQGDVVGLDGLNDKTHQMTLVAIENTLLCTFEYDKFYKELMQHPHMVKDLIPLLGHQVNRQNNYHLHHKDAEHKVYQFILKISEKKKQYGLCEKEFYLPMQYKDLANHLDIKVETLSRTISNINKKGNVLIKNKLVQIKDLSEIK
ncbi:MAG: cyclic nucleotide-binding domain-containing protein [Gammaproteobacteria bacterium]|nr:MAG: cyclic nucleotide-binding domain-containing protein [Gammaproteobacteria bacterium]UTW41754.1 cyclic nucleotide-binding domain-containing protein [bacterium SCSIO 12844]